MTTTVNCVNKVILKVAVRFAVVVWIDAVILPLLVNRLTRIGYFQLGYVKFNYVTRCFNIWDTAVNVART